MLACICRNLAKHILAVFIYNTYIHTCIRTVRTYAEVPTDALLSVTICTTCSLRSVLLCKDNPGTYLLFIIIFHGIILCSTVRLNYYYNYVIILFLVPHRDNSGTHLLFVVFKLYGIILSYYETYYLVILIIVVIIQLLFEIQH